MAGSFYIRRSKDGREGWTGSIRSYRQALRESAAWREAGWDTKIEDNTLAIRAEARAWQKAADERRGT